MDVKIHQEWKELLQDQFDAPYFENLIQFVKSEYATKTVYPPGKLIFNAFDKSPVSKVKVVILGQDPYHGPGQAHGLCFSVPDHIPAPPSLKNIAKEITNDIGSIALKTTNLEPWAEQGVFLLNATLTVRAHQAGSHQNKGWEIFTDAVMRKLSDEKEHIAFLLWGAYAIKKRDLIDESKHLVLTSVHPSPLSAARGFFGNHHFSKVNSFLQLHNETPIVW
ncbi:MAG: uracil-DNA glycosylase [Bacteroidales bacterium]|jgi:uracil-DNA glycosylase|nr:uracil-DNA glycosylase [Bacteroidales bacterium]